MLVLMTKHLGSVALKMFLWTPSYQYNAIWKIINAYLKPPGCCHLAVNDEMTDLVSSVFSWPLYSKTNAHWLLMSLAWVLKQFSYENDTKGFCQCFFWVWQELKTRFPLHQPEADWKSQLALQIISLPVNVFLLAPSKFLQKTKKKISIRSQIDDQTFKKLKRQI